MSSGEMGLDLLVKTVQRHHGEFEWVKAQYFDTNFLTGCFLQESIETQNVGKAQALVALPFMAPCSINYLEKNARNNQENLGYS